MSLVVRDVTLEDRAAIAEISIRAVWDDEYAKCVWPTYTLEQRIAGSYARWSKTFLTAESTYFAKVTDGEKTIAYAQWSLPDRFCAQQRAAKQQGLPDTQLEQYFEEANDSLAEPGWPRGMRKDVAESIMPAMEEARKAFPEGEYCMGTYLRQTIMFNPISCREADLVELVLLRTLPEYQRRGAGRMLVQWGCDFADANDLPILLEATPYGVNLYEKCGFRTVAEAHHDLSAFGGPDRYTHRMMFRRPRSIGSKP